MWKIHRYYLKEIGINALLTFLVLFGIALISLLYKGIRLVQGGDLLAFWHGAPSFPRCWAPRIGRRGGARADSISSRETGLEAGGRGFRGAGSG